MNNSTQKKVETRVEDRDLIVERMFDARRDLVFKMFSEPEHLANWWGPKGWETKNHRHEFELGGVWHYTMRCTDKSAGEMYGQESMGRTEFKEIDPPEKIVYTDVFADEDGNAVEGMPSMFCTLILEDHQDKTKLVLRTRFETEEELQKVVKMGVEEGISSQYEKLDDYLETVKK